MRFEWVLALRFLREGRMQTALIMAGATVGVAVIIFITALVNGLQASLASRTLSTQAHITVRAADEAPSPVLDRGQGEVAAHVEPRVQRLRSIDQWERVFRELPDLPHVVHVSPLATGSGFAYRGNASKSVALIEVGRYDQAMRDRARWLLARVGLADAVDKRPSALSGGMQQRVAIARALAMKPPLVLADEPTGNLDSHTADETFALMREFNRQEGAAFLIVTHDPGLAARCERRVELMDGQLRRAQTP